VFITSGGKAQGRENGNEDQRPTSPAPECHLSQAPQPGRRFLVVLAALHTRSTGSSGDERGGGGGAFIVPGTLDGR
jgi:hypothetical protein